MVDLPVRKLHPWNLSAEAAIAVQHDLAGQVERADRLGQVKYIAGLDVGFPRRGEQVVARAAAVLVDRWSLEPLAQAMVEEPVRYPYIPGLLSFREAPALLAALARLPMLPDLLLLDGQGIAHPRRFGIASHLGLLLDLPTIGCAKSRLVGTHATVPLDAGAWVPLEDRGEVVGAVVRTRSAVKPLFVSTGHRVGLDTAVALVLACCSGRRLPEPTRLADALASQRRTGDRGQSP